MTGRHRLAVGLSEPDSGSDAAALRTSAEDKGDHYVVRGQKAWCTGGGLPGTTIATYARTGPREPKHGGISLLLPTPPVTGGGQADADAGAPHPRYERGVLQ
ncbi:acyl-CoA dehydrogenase family protein [Streptomyces sp. KL116D]|uniref:acyl-CoA dehydrogenase family protein n=1 Tax=Streptomyces sp. KL116D TaxID=3045152 RepID=UPI003555FED7